MSSSETIRTFVGIPMVGAAREAVLMAQDLLRKGLRDERVVKWERGSNLHMTLQFLGDTPRVSVTEIAAALSRSVAAHRTFTLALTDIGAFGGNRPRVVVVKTGSGSEALVALQADVASALSSIGFESDRRPYSPHLTIGRVRRGRKLHRSELDRLADQAAELTAGATMEVREVIHFESELSPSGATYSRLTSIELPLS